MSEEQSLGHQDGDVVIEPLSDSEAEAIEAELLPENDLQTELEEAQQKAAANWEQVLRLQAELENSRRRAQMDIEKAHKFALEKIAAALLPVRDSMEMGLDAIANVTEHEAVTKLHEGTALTLKMLSDVMEKFDIKAVGEVGESFNPEFHQAMTMQESADHAPNSVMMMMQRGYTLNGRLLRPAMVVVSKAVSE